MGFLSDTDIRQYLAKGEIRIEPFEEGALTPNGYDVAAAEVVVPSAGGRTTSGAARIPPGTRFALSTQETVQLGRHVAGQIWLRTTWARRGVIAGFGMIDAGFRGTLTFGAFNASAEALDIRIGDKFAQIVFATLEAPASLTYDRRSGAYQDQKGVTLERP